MIHEVGGGKTRKSLVDGYTMSSSFSLFPSEYERARYEVKTDFHDKSACPISPIGIWSELGRVEKEEEKYQC